MAGVSRGTVDRVLFNRGRVSAATAERVRQAVDALGYTPNRSASCLAKKKTTRITCLIPSYMPGDYWQLIEKGFVQAEEEMSEYNLALKILHYDINDGESFSSQAATILADRPDGVITNAAPKEALEHLTQGLKEAGIPLAFIDNKYDDIDYMMYYGVDPYKSGELGAFLLTMRQDVRSVALVRIQDGDACLHDHNSPRRYGILDYLAAHFPSSPVYTIFVNPEAGDAREKLEAFFSGHPDCRHLICQNSRVYMLTDYLAGNPDPQRVVIGYDDLEANLRALQDGHVEFLVTRKVPEQSRLLLHDFAGCVMGRTAPLRKNNYVHMDILHRNNLDNYI